MKTIIILLSLLLTTPAIAGNVTVWGDDETKVITTMDDEGDTETYTSHKVAEGTYLLIDEEGNMDIVNDLTEED